MVPPRVRDFMLEVNKYEFERRSFGQLPWSNGKAVMETSSALLQATVKLSPTTHDHPGLTQRPLNDKA